MRARVSVVLLAMLVGAVGAAEAQTPIMAVRVRGSGPITDPLAAVWKDARPVRVAMLPQTVALPNKPDPAVTELAVRAVHNGGWIAFLIEWKDPTLSNTVILDNFGDQVALQLPIDTKAPPPSRWPSPPRRRPPRRPSRPRASRARGRSPIRPRACGRTRGPPRSRCSRRP